MELRRALEKLEAHRANIRTKLQLDDALSLMYHATRWVESQKTNA